MIETTKQAAKSAIFGTLIFLLVSVALSLLTTFSLLEVFGFWVLGILLYVILHNIYLYFTLDN